MGIVHIRALLTSGYGALEQLLRDFERMGLELEQVEVQRMDDVATKLDARLGNMPTRTIASLASRLEQHIGVTDAIAVEGRESVRVVARHELA